MLDENLAVAVHGAVLATFLILLSYYDWRTLRLPDALTLGLALIGLAVAAMLDSGQLPSALLGAALGWICLTLVALAYQSVRKRPGLGGGDAKLLGAGGVWIGWSGLPLVLLVACFSGLLFALLSGRHKATDKMPFGPFLCLGIWVAWLIGPDWPLVFVQ